MINLVFLEGAKVVGGNLVFDNQPPLFFLQGCNKCHSEHMGKWATVPESWTFKDIEAHPDCFKDIIYFYFRYTAHVEPERVFVYKK